MAGFLLLSSVILCVIGHSAFAIPPLLIGGVYHGDQASGGYEKKSLVLTCALNFTDKYKNYKGVANALAVTIKENPSQHGSGMKWSTLFSHGGDYGSSGLEATIDIYSSIGGPVVVAITETARPEEGCYADDFGSFLNTKSDYGGHGAYSGIGKYHSAYGYGHFGYGSYGMAGYGSYGMAGYGGMGGGSYGKDYGKGHNTNYHEPVDEIPGVIAKVALTPYTTASVSVDHLADFDNLEDLAGRGVVVCPVKSVDSEYSHSYCDSGILSCCALHYDDDYQKLYGKY